MLPGVTVTITNVDTGAERVVVTNEQGLYRAPLLPLGTYRVVAELQGFKKFEQTGIKLSVGQTAVVNVTLARRHGQRNHHRAARTARCSTPRASTSATR